MGEVYRATDTTLDREVAIKILPDEFADSPERLAHFEREAESLAALNHTNIASIFGFEEHQGKRYLVLELVAGQTLARRLKRDPYLSKRRSTPDNGSLSPIRRRAGLPSCGGKILKQTNRQPWLRTSMPPGHSPFRASSIPSFSSSSTSRPELRWKLRTSGC